MQFCSPSEDNLSAVSINVPKADTPSVSLLSSPESDFFFEAAHTFLKKDVNCKVGHMSCL